MSAKVPKQVLLNAVESAIYGFLFLTLGSLLGATLNRLTPEPSEEESTGTLIGIITIEMFILTFVAYLINILLILLPIPNLGGNKNLPDFAREIGSIFLGTALFMDSDLISRLGILYRRIGLLRN